MNGLLKSQKIEELFPGKWYTHRLSAWEGK